MRSMSYEQASQRLWRQGREFFSLASTPHDEPCTPAGGDINLQRVECMALALQLSRMYGFQEGAELFILRNDHEFGCYLELGVMYQEPKDEDNPEELKALEFAQKLEGGIPEKWDQQAIDYLRENGYFQEAKVIPITKAA